jgi:hypothetical protein
LSNCENSGSFEVCCLIRPFTLSLITCPYISLYHSYDLMFYKVITTLCLSPLSGLLLFQVTEESKLWIFLFPTVPFLLILGSSEHYNSLTGSIKSR